MARTKDEKKVADLEREVRRLNHFLSNANKNAAQESRRAENATEALKAEARGFHAVTVRMAFGYGEDVMDEKRGKVIGKVLKLPPMDAEEIRKYQVKGRTDEDGNGIIAVGLYDDPDDHKSDAELEAEEEAYREAQGSGME